MVKNYSWPACSSVAPQIPQLSVKYIYKAGWLNLGQFSLASGVGSAVSAAIRQDI